MKSASELKQWHERLQPDSLFFTRNTMKFFGDTMRNYGVRGPVVVSTWGRDNVTCFELYRRNPVKHGLSDSAYFDCTTGERVIGRT